MRRPFAVLVLPLLAAALGGSLAGHEPAPSVPAGQIAVEASFEKGGERPGQYICTVTVKDLATGVVLTAPRVQLLAGEPATLTSKAQEYEVEVTTFVTRGGTQVDLAVIVRRDGVKTAAQATTIKLPL